MKSKKSNSVTKMIACIAVTVLGVVCMPRLQVNAAAYSSDWTDTYSWEDTILPALQNEQTDVNGVYQQLKLGIQYKVLSEGNIRHLYELDDINLPIEAVQELYENGYVSGYLYKLLSGEEMTISDMPDYIFDADYYYANNKDIQAEVGTDENALFQHFITEGMAEGRVASEEFNINYYKANYPELVETYGTDNAAYYQHYILYGKFEGRTADELEEYN